MFPCFSFLNLPITKWSHHCPLSNYPLTFIGFLTRNLLNKTNSPQKANKLQLRKKKGLPVSTDSSSKHWIHTPDQQEIRLEANALWLKISTLSPDWWQSEKSPMLPAVLMAPCCAASCPGITYTARPARVAQFVFLCNQENCSSFTPWSSRGIEQKISEYCCCAIHLPVSLGNSVFNNQCHLLSPYLQELYTLVCTFQTFPCCGQTMQPIFPAGSPRPKAVNWHLATFSNLVTLLCSVTSLPTYLPSLKHQVSSGSSSLLRWDFAFFPLLHPHTSQRNFSVSMKGELDLYMLYYTAR